MCSRNLSLFHVWQREMVLLKPGRLTQIGLLLKQISRNLEEKRAGSCTFLLVTQLYLSTSNSTERRTLGALPAAPMEPRPRGGAVTRSQPAGPGAAQRWEGNGLLRENQETEVNPAADAPPAVVVIKHLAGSAVFALLSRIHQN